MGSLFHLQGIFPTQGSNTGLLNRSQILYQLSHKGGPEKPLKIKCLLNIKKKERERESKGLAKVKQVNYRLRTEAHYFKSTPADRLSSQNLYVNKTGLLNERHFLHHVSSANVCGSETKNSATIPTYQLSLLLYDVELKDVLKCSLAFNSGQ